ncbi:MAG: hypothetical protein U9N30_09540 [Campylobacterota bacterium]|nr:hypothetical protein [Campylobacterota bacterium]
MNKLHSKLRSERGAMDKVLVTLLFVVIGTAGVIGFETWTKDHVNAMEAQAVAKVDLVMQEVATASGD